MTKFRTHSKKAYVFSGAAVLITAGFLAQALLFTGCPNNAVGGGGNSTGDSGEPAEPSYVQVAYNQLEAYIRDTASKDKKNYIEVTDDIPKKAFKANPPAASELAQILKKVALKIGTYSSELTDMSSCFSGCTNLVSLENILASVKNIQNCFNGCTALEGVRLKCDYNSTEIAGFQRCF